MTSPDPLQFTLPSLTRDELLFLRELMNQPIAVVLPMVDAAASARKKILMVTIPPE